MTAVLAIFLVYLFCEGARLVRGRRRVTRRIAVTGTRGKSGVTRLVAAGLKASGARVVAKTTGSKPMLSHANTRTVAANVGEELLERLRAFRRVSTDPDGALFAFADIDDAYVNQTIQRGGINYTVTADVKGYNLNDDRTAVTETDPAVAGTVYDFKVVDLVIAWDSSQSFQIDNEGASVTNTAMGSGDIEISGLIPSIPSLGSPKVAAEDDGELGYVPVDYTPGERPDIIAIDLNNNKFKESTTPMPEVR